VARIPLHTKRVVLGKLKQNLVITWSRNDWFGRPFKAWRWNKGSRISGTYEIYRSFDPHRPYQLIRGVGEFAVNVRARCAPVLAFDFAWRQNSAMAHQFTTSYMKDAVDLFWLYKRLGERAIEQCPEDGLFSALDGESNSIAIIVKHMTGNMRSRWTDFLTTDGEKADRNRDTEFEEQPANRAALMALWEGGWKIVFKALGPLTDADLTRTVMIRTEPHSVMQAINRQVAHYSYHVGQIVFLAKHFAARQTGSWNSLSVPRKKSGEFNADVAAGRKSQR